MKINKQELLKALSAAKPGLSAKEIVEETVRFIFTGKEVTTFNDKICIIIPFETDFACSVHGDEFYKILSSIKEEEVDITVVDNQMKINAKKTKAGLSTIIGEKERVISLIENLQTSTKKKGFWKKLPEDFLQGIYLCMFTASKDMTTKVRCCVAVKGDKIFSTDNLRISRYILSSEMEEMLIPARDAMELVKYEVKKYGLSDGWVHFITNEGIMFNCRIMLGDYPFTSISKYFREPENEIEIPVEMKEVMKTAAVVAEGEVDIAKVVEVIIEAGKIICKSEDKGKKWLVKEIDFPEYEGDKVLFYVNPSFFAQVLDKSTSLFLVQGEELPDKAVFTSENFQSLIALPT